MNKDKDVTALGLKPRQKFGKRIGQGVFKTKFEFFMHPGDYENVVVPILGLAFRIDKFTVLYVCTIWDEENLDNSIIKIFFLRTNMYKSPKSLNRALADGGEARRLQITENTGNLYIFPASQLLALIQSFSPAALIRTLLVFVARPLFSKIEKLFYKIQTIFFRVGVNQVTVTQNELQIDGSLGILVAQFKLLELNRQLKEMWWREYLNGERIFVEIDR